MPIKHVQIDWDWGATGIWSASSPDEPPAPMESGQWLAHTPAVAEDRHRAWRGLLSDDLIEALQVWNDLGDEYLGRQAHRHSDQERESFWAQGQLLAEQAQQQLGPDYEVVCRTPESFGLH
jgi:hypothetical protein